MNAAPRRTGRVLVVLLFLGLMASRVGWSADFQPGTAKVQAILGRAQFSRASGPFAPLGPGMVLHPGDVVQTATSSAVDLYLVDGPGALRLTESATLALEKLSVTDAQSGGSFQVQLHLRSGELLGLSKTVPSESRFEIKVSNGMAQVLRGRFRIDAQGNFVLVEGKALFAHVPPGGEPMAYTLTAPRAVYFSPGSGVQPAPHSLEREVIKQMRSKLPRR